MDRHLPTFADIVDADARLKASGLVETMPVLRNDALDDAAGAAVFVKAECLQTTGSFKIRGAVNRLSQMTADQRAAGVVAFSSGNHAQGIARAARVLGIPAVIVMPSDAPEIKAAGVRADGAEIRTYDRNSEAREAIAAEIAADRGAVVVPSFDDADIIAGQGTAGLEFQAQLAERGTVLDHLICCLGGGGLLSGLALAFEEKSPDTKIWGAEPEGHDDWARSLQAGEIVSNAPGTRSICDAILTKAPGDLTWAIGARLFAGVLSVCDDEARAAVRFAARHLKLVAEPGGAAALACALRGLPGDMQGKNVGLLITGGNIDPAALTEILSDGAV